MAVPGFVQEMLNHGISVVSVEYRLLDEATADGLSPPVNGPMLDCARALQFVRSKSKAWHLDKQWVALCGDSVGGCTALWLAFHKDLDAMRYIHENLSARVRPTCARRTPVGVRSGAAPRREAADTDANAIADPDTPQSPLRDREAQRIYPWVA